MYTSKCRTKDRNPAIFPYSGNYHYINENLLKYGAIGFQCIENEERSCFII